MQVQSLVNFQEFQHSRPYRSSPYRAEEVKVGRTHSPENDVSKIPVGITNLDRRQGNAQNRATSIQRPPTILNNTRERITLAAIKDDY